MNIIKIILPYLDKVYYLDKDTNKYINSDEFIIEKIKHIDEDFINRKPDSIDWKTYYKLLKRKDRYIIVELINEDKYISIDRLITLYDNINLNSNIFKLTMYQYIDYLWEYLLYRDIGNLIYLTDVNYYKTNYYKTYFKLVQYNKEYCNKFFNIPYIFGYLTDYIDTRNITLIILYLLYYGDTNRKEILFELMEHNSVISNRILKLIT